jgi:hypothetical protein
VTLSLWTSCSDFALRNWASLSSTSSVGRPPFSKNFSVAICARKGEVRRGQGRVLWAWGRGEEKRQKERKRVGGRKKWEGLQGATNSWRMLCGGRQTAWLPFRSIPAASLPGPRTLLCPSPLFLSLHCNVQPARLHRPCASNLITSCSPLTHSLPNRPCAPRPSRRARNCSASFLARTHPIAHLPFLSRIQGVLAGYDQKSNVVLSDSKERVYSADEGVEEVPLGLYLVKGDMMYVSCPPPFFSFSFRLLPLCCSVLRPADQCPHDHHYSQHPHWRDRRGTRWRDRPVYHSCRSYPAHSILDIRSAATSPLLPHFPYLPLSSINLSPRSLSPSQSTLTQPGVKHVPYLQ